MLGIVHTLVIGIPLSILLMTLGLFFCATIVFIPVGLTCFALGSKVLTIRPPRHV
jgi:hypothetical protein